MIIIYKKITALILLFFFTFTPVLAKERVKLLSQINHEFKLSQMPEYVELKVTQDIIIQDEINIPKDSILKAQVMEAQSERRWHRSGFIICKLLEYKDESAKETIDVSEKNIYLVARKYEALNKKEAAIITTEIILTQAAAIVGSCFIVFAPVDIAYFFTKGAIQRKNNPNWFKAGVSCAYDNSIFWFWLKGKPIDMEENQSVKLKEIKEKRAVKLTSKIKNKKENLAVKTEKKALKAEIKQNKKELKALLKEEKIKEKNINKIITQTDLEKFSDNKQNTQQEIASNPDFKACAKIDVK